jgi:ketosteroid isomerase-like protein
LSRLDTIRGVYDEWARGNLHAGLELYDPDMTLEVHTPIPDAAIFEGRDGLQRYMRQFLGTWEDYETRAVEFQEHGDTVLVRVHHRGRASGLPVENNYFQAWTFSGDRVVRMDIAYDAPGALEGASRIG